MDSKLEPAPERPKRRAARKVATFTAGLAEAALESATPAEQIVVASPLQGNLDRAEPTGLIGGWCWSPDEPESRRDLIVSIDGREVSRVSADMYRSDLASAGIGDGRHAFLKTLEPGLLPATGRPATVELRDSATHATIGHRDVTFVLEEVRAPEQRGETLTLLGGFDGASGDGYVSGWCWYPGRPDIRAELTILVDDVPVGRTLANRLRPDLVNAGIGDGSYSFRHPLHPAIVSQRRARRIAVVDARTGTTLGETRVVQFTGTPLEFDTSTAIIDLKSRVKVSYVALDGRVLAGSQWRVSRHGSLRIALHPAVFDTRAHQLTVGWDDPHADTPGTWTFRSEYFGNLDDLTEEGASGWLFDALRPGADLFLEVRSGSEPPQEVEISVQRPDLAEVTGQPVARVGFRLAFPPRTTTRSPESLTVTVGGSFYQPFGTILRGSALSAAISTIAGAGRALGDGADRVLYNSVLLPGLLDQLKNPNSAAASLWPPATVVQLASVGRSERLPPSVAIVIPVYRGREDTLACVASVLKSADRVSHRIIVVDDCSPDTELSADLGRMAAAGDIEYIFNQANLGFVASANIGFAAAAGCDVLLLNADTVVPAGFLDRLYRAAYSDRNIGTVTPLSNNATIFSLPESCMVELLPYGLPAEQIDLLCQAENADRIQDVPTAHGFCMFIKRAALDHVGPFDTAEFGAGYGEENDFSMRALLRGWRNVVAPNVYVYHKGSVSFGPQREERELAAGRKVAVRYPFYPTMVTDFIVNDPLFGARNAVQKALWRRGGPIVIVVSLALPGGTARHAGDVAARLAAEGFQVLTLSPVASSATAAGSLLKKWGSSEATRYPATAGVAAVIADIVELRPQLICVEHLIDLPDGIAEFILDSGIPYTVTLHDFFYACPRITLLDGGNSYCGMPPASACTACVSRGGIHSDLHPTLRPHAERGAPWRSKWDGFLRGSWQVIAPSHDTAARYAHLFPGLEIDVRPHFRGRPDSAPPVPVRRFSAYRKIRVAIPGHLHSHKGREVLLDLARHCSIWAEDIVFFAVGHQSTDAALAALPNIKLLGPYEEDKAVQAIVRARCRVALFLSLFPETYCYTLSESLEAGLTPVAYDFGALGERLRRLNVGVLVPPRSSPAAIVDGIRQAALLRTEVSLQDIDAHYERLFGDYFPATAITARPAPAPRARLLTWPKGLDGLGECSSKVLLELWSPTEIHGVRLVLALPRGVPFQLLTVTCEGAELARENWEGAGEKTVLVECLCTEQRLVRFTCEFKFAAPSLPGGNLKAAFLRSLRVVDGLGEHNVDFPSNPTPGDDFDRAPAGIGRHVVPALL